MAKSGILNHKKATTHWKLVENFTKNHSLIQLVENVVYVKNQNLYKSAGITSAIDLALDIVDEQYGPILTSKIAAEMILFSRRKSSDKQISVHLQFRGHHRIEIDKFQDWLSQNLENNPNVDEMAEAVSMSTRNFSRACKNTIG